MLALGMKRKMSNIESVLYLKEEDVIRYLPMARAIEVVEQAARDEAAGRAQKVPRMRVTTDKRMMHVLPAGSDALRHLGLKAYLSGGSLLDAWYLLFNENGLEAILQADSLGRIRTGAASGVATRLLARENATSMAILGSGNQAYTQVEAVAQVRALTQVRVYSRDAERRMIFAKKLREDFAFDVVVCDNAETAVKNADIVTTMTTAKEPIFDGAWLAPYTHVNAAGSNRATHREIDDAVIQRADRLVVEDIAQAKLESGDLLRCDNFDWSVVEELGQALVGKVRDSAKSQGDITLFESLGIGLWDLAAATEVVARARADQAHPVERAFSGASLR
jgi:alanine dehydrogenase